MDAKTATRPADIIIKGGDGWGQAWGCIDAGISMKMCWWKHRRVQNFRLKVTLAHPHLMRWWKRIGFYRSKELAVKELDIPFQIETALHRYTFDWHCLQVMLWPDDQTMYYLWCLPADHLPGPGKDNVISPKPLGDWTEGTSRCHGKRAYCKELKLHTCLIWDVLHTWVILE